MRSPDLPVVRRTDFWKCSRNWWACSFCARSAPDDMVLCAASTGAKTLCTPFAAMVGCPSRGEDWRGEGDERATLRERLAAGGAPGFWAAYTRGRCAGRARRRGDGGKVGRCAGAGGACLFVREKLRRQTKSCSPSRVAKPAPAFASLTARSFPRLSLAYPNFLDHQRPPRQTRAPAFLAKHDWTWRYAIPRASDRPTANVFAGRGGQKGAPVSTSPGSRPTSPS